ncbi:MAG: hypothetical protein FWG20_07260 [Candidatus Cloacimonetes bacterium]|nr:hypothetical protein [Candidatus Cloacimonadota bacterium]
MELSEKDQAAAIKIIQECRKKKSCNTCYDRGYIGFTPEKMLVPCDKCVDLEKAMAGWKEYVSKDKKLREEFKELFEDDTETPDEKIDATEHKEQHENHDHHVPAAVDTKPRTKKPAVKKEANIKTAKSTTVRKSGQR